MMNSLPLLIATHYSGGESGQEALASSEKEQLRTDIERTPTFRRLNGGH